MKLKLILIIAFISVNLNTKAQIAEHFDLFFKDYVKIHQVDLENYNDLKLIGKISNAKFRAFENFLITSDAKQDRLYAISLINEEYRELLENINFELNYINCCQINQKHLKKIKKAHKKYMRQLEKIYS